MFHEQHVFCKMNPCISTSLALYWKLFLPCLKVHFEGASDIPNILHRVNPGGFLKSSNRLTLDREAFFNCKYKYWVSSPSPVTNPHYTQLCHHQRHLSCWRRHHRCQNHHFDCHHHHFNCHHHHQCTWLPSLLWSNKDYPSLSTLILLWRPHHHVSH